jgi:thiamine-monophosphate kinase
LNARRRRTVRDLGEFGLIARVLPLLEGAGPQPLVGAGDDGAAWEQPAAVLVATTDALVQGVHFDLALTSWEDLGWKALAVNLSDLAAMGATPSWALVSLALPPDIEVQGVEALYRGLAQMAEEAGCRVVGGDTVGARQELVLGVTALGSVPAGEGETLLRRDRARAGDRIAVTGTLGGSAAGLYALRHPRSATPETRAALGAVHRRPQPQIAAGRRLRVAGVRCAMDVSDGLLADVGKLCAASGAGARLSASRLPLHPFLRTAYPERALEWAATGGEDYQLLFTAPPETMARALEDLAGAGIPAAEIGTVTGRPGEVRLLDGAGRDVPLARAGWDHFAPAS